MKDFLKKEVGITIVVLIAIFLLIVWAHYKRVHDFKPPQIKNATVGINFGPDGKLIFIDENGETVEPVSLTDQIKRKCQSKKEFEIKEITTITVYSVTGSKEVWYVEDGMSTCYLYNDNYTKYLGRCN